MESRPTVFDLIDTEHWWSKKIKWEEAPLEGVDPPSFIGTLPGNQLLLVYRDSQGWTCELKCPHHVTLKAEHYFKPYMAVLTLMEGLVWVHSVFEEM